MQTKIIDWQLCLKLANNKKDLAEELLRLFIAELPIVHQQIIESYQAKDYISLKEHIHKLHGACCYCGVPHLKAIILELETICKKRQYTKLSHLMNDLTQEVKAVLKAYKQKNREIHG